MEWQTRLQHATMPNCRCGNSDRRTRSAHQHCKDRRCGSQVTSTGALRLDLTLYHAPNIEFRLRGKCANQQAKRQSQKASNKHRTWAVELVPHFIQLLLKLLPRQGRVGRVKRRHLQQLTVECTRGHVHVLEGWKQGHMCMQCERSRCGCGLGRTGAEEPRLCCLIVCAESRPPVQAAMYLQAF